MGTKPILVCMVWRGGDRFARCLRSIEGASDYFSRVVISITGEHDGPDMQMASEARESVPNIEVICTGAELPTMQHQSFWIDYLVETDARADDWVCWLAYDDELRIKGIQAVTDEGGSWNLTAGTAYFGPWAMRGDGPHKLWNGQPDEPTESWTSFPTDGPTRLPVARWIAEQLRQPTYMQMSGSLNPLASFIDLKESHPRKRGPMRIEMAIASAPGTLTVEEFPEPITFIYGRADSDRASYGKAARREDIHLVLRLLRYGAHNPSSLPALASSTAGAGVRSALSSLGWASLPSEEWRSRGIVG